ncbi:MAG TPA: proprotein convertase P-domain-containing protein, partial [Verrucomicrobiae bacterium]
MKNIFMAGLLCGTLISARASLFIQGATGQSGASVGSIQNATIVDGNPSYLIANTMDLTSAGLGSVLASITVTLNISGGMNNGLYAYLVAPDGTTVTLMNQPGVGVDGFGATGAGMNITLADAGATGIQNVTSGSALSGTYSAAGSLSGFNGVNPNGAWTIYFADTISGGGDATLNGWSLDITTVPEPVNVALGLFAVAVFGVGLAWPRRSSHESRGCGCESA